MPHKKSLYSAAKGFTEQSPCFEWQKKLQYPTELHQCGIHEFALLVS